MNLTEEPERLLINWQSIIVAEICVTALETVSSILMQIV